MSSLQALVRDEVQRAVDDLISKSTPIVTRKPVVLRPAQQKGQQKGQRKGQQKGRSQEGYGKAQGKGRSQHATTEQDAALVASGGFTGSRSSGKGRGKARRSGRMQFQKPRHGSQRADTLLSAENMTHGSQTGAVGEFAEMYSDDAHSEVSIVDPPCVAMETDTAEAYEEDLPDFDE